MKKLLAVAVVVTMILACRDSQSAETRAETTHVQLPLPDTTVPAGGGGFVLRHVVDSGTTYKYQVFVPKGFDSKKKWPVIVYLAGSGERGVDGSIQTQGGLGDYVRAHPDSLSAIVVFPQSPRIARGVGRAIFVRLVMSELDSVMKQFNGDPKRVYVAGFSYGASVLYEMLPQFLPRVAALVMISGPCTNCFAENGLLSDSLTTAALEPMKTIPTWIFHSAQDTVMLVTYVRPLVTALKAMGSTVRYTEYPDGPHDITARVFESPELFRWLLAQHRSP